MEINHGKSEVFIAFYAIPHSVEASGGNPLAVKIGLSFWSEPGALYQGMTPDEIEDAHEREIEELDREFEEYFLP